MRTPPKTTRWIVFASAAFVIAFALMLLAYINTPRSSEVVPAATATRAVPSVIAQTTATQKLTRTFGTLGEVETVVIDEEELSLGGYMQRHYELVRVGEQLQGQANFTCHYYICTHGVVVRFITIPATSAQRFLDVLESGLQAIPPPTATPTTTMAPATQTDRSGVKTAIAVRTSTQTTHFVTGYSIPSYVPIAWTVEAGAQDYATYSHIPDDALAILKPYLREDIIKSFYNNTTPAP